MTKEWFDRPSRVFKANDRNAVTILFGGLTEAHDFLLEGALKGLGYRVKHLECPDLESLRYGKEFGNRGQCNPAYFTVGNLIKYLCRLRDVEGKSKEEIVGGYLFITTGSCGPCRFGIYAAEYRKALRDAGFEGFRVFLIRQLDGLKQDNGGESALDLNASFVLAALKAIFLGDILNAAGYRLRPYETEPGLTDAVIERCKRNLYTALSRRKGLIPALLKCRKELQTVTVNRLEAKPKVSIIGEIWAMTTEGDGNYRLQRFLEQEGAEVEVQPLAAWILYLIWTRHYDASKRMNLRNPDRSVRDLETKQPAFFLFKMALADRAVRTMFGTYARIIGLSRYALPDMKEMAQAADPYYNNQLRGGEGHMEVGKLVLNAAKQKANLTISVKPFGCMPSSGVSDGIQSLITELYPEANFLSLETTGDGAVNFYSRVQMKLFKAKQIAQKEFEEALQSKGVTASQMEKYSLRPCHPLQTGRHVVACTAANTVYANFGGALKKTFHGIRNIW